VRCMRKAPAMTESNTLNEPTRTRKGLLAQLEIDTRLLGMIGAFLLLCIVFNILTEGRFLTRATSST
jgi:D-xylose transport system permease protein